MLTLLAKADMTIVISGGGCVEFKPQNKVTVFSKNDTQT
jgi:hypothetical protein